MFVDIKNSFLVVLNGALRCGDCSLMFMDTNNFKIITIILRKANTYIRVGIILPCSRRLYSGLKCR